MKQLVLLTLFFLCCLPGSLAQSPALQRLDGSRIPADSVDAVVKRLMHKSGIEGLSLAVLNKRKTVYLKSFGYRNKPANELLDTATIMYGASLSKGVCGFLTLKLVQQGVLDLDKPLGQYLSKPLYEYEYFSDLRNDPRWEKITARMCLSHTTGLPNVRWVHPQTGADDTLGTMRIYFDPGTRYAYSGEGFKLLQLVLEELTGQPLDALAVKEIFQPFGMYRTGYVWHDDFGDNNVAVGHLSNGMLDKKKKRKDAVAGGSIVTTIADFARFTENLLQEKGLDRKGYREMTRPHIRIHSVTQFPPITTETTTENDAIGLSYGLGWGLIRCQQGPAYFKEGNGGPWRNYTILFPKQGTAVVILVNSENGERVFRELVETVLGPTCIPWKWEGYDL